MQYKGVIFDLDGTLVNSIDDIADSMNKVLTTHGFPAHSTDAYKAFVGRGMTNLVIRALPEDARDAGHIGIIRDAMLAEYSANYLNKTRPYDGIIDLITELTRLNIERAVFSNKVDHLTKKIMAELFPGCNFTVVLGSGPEWPEKPDPKGVLAISVRINIEPKDLIYVGDSDVDMQTARNAGMHPAGALWGFRTKDELVSNGAEFLLAHPMDLIPLVR
jgi:phosphoglycolate phosphatase